MERSVDSIDMRLDASGDNGRSFVAAYLRRWSIVIRRQLVLMVVLAWLLFTATASFAAETSGVKIWETKIVIPTYLAGDPDPNPMFFFGRESQGSLAPVYPYPMWDSLTGKKADKTYTIVYLENEYIRIGVLPEIGGRIFEGVDKTNGFNFIYRQHVIKPALIGLLGAWISGGLEWNVPYHHRATTFLPVQYKTEENADGSKTIWVGELEVRQRTRWAVGYTLRPGKSYLEAAMRIVNRTPESNTMLCFANLAIHANDTYQVIFPPSTQFGVFHAKHEFTEWPISRSVYNGEDFTKGVDISWYKNHNSASSVFAWNYQDDFFAGYDHGKEAGTMSVSDHNIVPGKKFWTWGNGPSGKRWDATLTDDDGPYIELMTGAYSDNQPDYSWLQPYETRSFSMNWYPFRDIGGVKEANLDAAVNFEVNNGTAKVGFYTTSAHNKARVLIKAGDKVMLEETISINPAKPYVRQVAVPGGIDEHELVASIWDGDRELVSYSPIRLTHQEKPATVTLPPAPQDVKTNEELYLIGLRAEQFHDPNLDPAPYWQEALRRDPADVRVNTVLGIGAYNKARYTEAEKYLRKAVARATDRYTAPKDAEPIYYLGATLKAEGKLDEAYACFYKSTWSAAWKAAGYYSLAQVATERGDMAAALDFVNRSIDSNALNIRAQNLKMALLRHLGRQQEAMATAASASHDADPLDVRAAAEAFLATGNKIVADSLATTMNSFPATAQETAAEYLDEGLWQDGIDVLLLSAARAPDKSRIHPMTYYYLGYFAGKLGQTQKAQEYYQQAMAMPSDYVFPFQSEAIGVLRQAIAANPHDARAPYYLGNVLYDWQPEEATRMWEASEALDPSFAITHRNLAIAYMHQASGANIEKAIAELEQAVQLEHKYALHFTELDELYEQAGTPLQKRLKLFQENAPMVARRDDSLNRDVALQIATGQVDDAIRTMTEHTFAVAEGENLNVVDHWTEAHILRARAEIQEKRYEPALADLKAGGSVPSNLPASFEFGGATVYDSEIAYLAGVAYQGQGNTQKAAECWKKVVAPSSVGSHTGESGVGAGAPTYYQGLAFRKLGQEEKALGLFRDLVQSGQNALKQAATSTGPSRRRAGQQVSQRLEAANAHYLAGLGYMGLKDETTAKAELNQAIQLSPDLLGVKTALNSVQ
jgi:tetratricopeptide (TPR) repeat protein